MSLYENFLSSYPVQGTVLRRMLGGGRFTEENRRVKDPYYLQAHG